MEGSSFPSVCDTSNVFTTLKARMVTSTFSITGSPSASSTGFPLSSSLVCSLSILYGAGARILIPFSPFFTYLPISFHPVKLWQRLASGLCIMIRMELFTEYRGNLAIVSRNCLYLSLWNTSTTPFSSWSVTAFNWSACFSLDSMNWIFFCTPSGISPTISASGYAWISSAISFCASQLFLISGT